MTQKVIELPDLAHGANATLPAGVMSAGPVKRGLWRELRNLRPHEGALRPRERLTAWSITPPTWLDDEDQEVILLAEVFPSGSAVSLSARYLMVTTRELYLYSEGTTSWHNLTPRYEVGTVSITNGTNTLTGTSTLWATRYIRGQVGSAAGQAIELPRNSGDWYEIQSVGGETSITLATNYTGTTLSGANYSIRRTFDYSADEATWHAHWAVINGDIYVAGQFGAGPLPVSPFATVGGGAVLKIDGGADPLKLGTFSPTTDVEYLTASEEIVAGLDSVGYYHTVWGMVALPDGRLVVGIRWFDQSSGEGGLSRLLYSSHLNLAVWTTSPGGFVDITSKYDGPLTAVRNGTRAVYVHFTDGIEAGALTGADDPPLSLHPSRARRGAVSPKMIQWVNGGPRTAAGDIFIGIDRRMYSFSGDSSNPVGMSTNGLLGSTTVEALRSGFSRFDGYRGEVSFAWRETGRTEEMRVLPDGDAIYEASYPASFYEAVSIEYGVEADQGRDQNVALYGMSRNDDGGSATGLIYEMREDSTADSVADNTGTTPVTVTGQALSDYFLLGGDAAMRKLAVLEVVVWVIHGSTASPALDVTLLRDTVTVALPQATESLTANKLTPIRFLVEPPIAAYQQQIRITNTGRISQIVRVQVVVEDLGSGRAE